MRAIFIFVSCLVLTMIQIGCASKGFDRGELKKQIGIESPKYDDDEIKAAFKKESNLPKPFKLGIYFKAPRKTNGFGGDWRWTEQDKSLIQAFVEDLKTEDMVSDVFPILGSLVSDDDLKTVRLAAAQHHADALLIVGGAAQIDRYINGWGWTYVFLVPTLFVPGSEADTLFVSNASLWDVRNGYLYISAEAEAERNKTYIAAFGSGDKELIDQAKTDSLNSLVGEIKKMIKGTKL